MDLLTRMVEHHVWLVGEMVTARRAAPDDELDAPIEISVDGIDDEPTIRSLLVAARRPAGMWNAAIATAPTTSTSRSTRASSSMRARLAEAGPAFLGQVREVVDEGRLDETFVDAICEPPEVFTYGGMIAHVLTFAAHRRTLSCGALTDAGDHRPRLRATRCAGSPSRPEWTAGPLQAGGVKPNRSSRPPPCSRPRLPRRPRRGRLAGLGVRFEERVGSARITAPAALRRRRGIVADVRHSQLAPHDGEVTHRVMVRVEDAKAHCEHARANGAKIAMEPTDFEYGEASTRPSTSPATTGRSARRSATRRPRSGAASSSRREPMLLRRRAERPGQVALEGRREQLDDALWRERRQRLDADDVPGRRQPDDLSPDQHGPRLGLVAADGGRQARDVASDGLPYERRRLGM